MFFLGSCIYQYAIDEDDHEFIQVVFTHPIHKVHEYSWCVGMSKWHNQKIIVTILSSECRLWNIFFLNLELMVVRSHIDLRVVEESL